MVETAAARRREAWPSIRRAAVGVLAFGFVVALPAWLTVLAQAAQPEYAHPRP